MHVLENNLTLYCVHIWDCCLCRGAAVLTFAKLLQGERITQGISYADVADVCLKALHDRAARNKTFEVCHEYTPEEGLEQYELVAHVPNKSNNYLAAALSVLEKNT